jgi:hypothetical protein
MDNTDSGEFLKRLSEKRAAEHNSALAPVHYNLLNAVSYLLTSEACILNLKLIECEKTPQGNPPKEQSERIERLGTLAATIRSLNEQIQEAAKELSRIG